MYFQSTNSFVLEPAEYGPESAEPVANVGQIYSVEPQSITCEYSRPVEVFFWDFLPIFLLLSLIVQDADSQITDQTPDVKRESSGLQTTSPLKKEAAEDASEHQVTIEEEVANKSETSLMENSHLSVDVSDANDRSTAMDEGGLTFFPLFIFIIRQFFFVADETHIQSLKSNPAIEVQLDESLDEDKAKAEDSGIFQTSVEGKIRGSFGKSLT